MANRISPYQHFLRGSELAGSVQKLVTIVTFLSLFPASAWATDDGYYDVEIKAIEAFLVDQVTGKLSKNIVGANRSVFVSTGSANNTRTKSAGDVLVTVHFERTYNQAFQPSVTIFALAHLKNGVPPYEDFISVVQWQNENDLDFGGVQENNATATMLLKDATCHNLDIVAVVDGGSTVVGDRAAVILPFVCKE